MTAPATVVNHTQPTIADVCIFTGAGYGACPECPNVNCELQVGFNDDNLPIVAAGAVAKLRTNSFQIEGMGGDGAVVKITEWLTGFPAGLVSREMQDEWAALWLSLEMMQDESQGRLRAWVASEAVTQGLCDRKVAERYDELWQHHVNWMRGINRLLTQDEEAEFQDRLDGVRKTIAEELYLLLTPDQLLPFAQQFLPEVAIALRNLFPMRQKPTPAWTERCSPKAPSQ